MSDNKTKALKTGYQLLLEDFEKTYFVSMLSEYARLCEAKYTQVLGIDVSTLFQKVLSLVFNTTEKEWLEGDYFLGDMVKLKNQKVYIHGFERNKELKLIFKQKDQFHIFTYLFKKLSNSVTSLTYKHKIKWRYPIVGLNGFLGKWKFRKEHKKEAITMFQYLNKILS